MICVAAKVRNSFDVELINLSGKREKCAADEEPKIIFLLGSVRASSIIRCFK